MMKNTLNDREKFESDALEFIRKREAASVCTQDLSRLSAPDTGDELMAIWDDFELVSQVDLLGSPEDFQSDIDVLDGDDEPSPEGVVSLLPARNRLRRYTALATAAVICVLAFMLPAYYGIPQTYTIASNVKKTIYLDDGSSILLDSGSKLSLSEGFGRRYARLEQGAAYFSVAKNPNKPFVVDADKTQVSVLGTAFSVYRKGDFLEVVVESGKVAVASSSLPDDAAYRVVLTKNEKLLISAAGDLDQTRNVEVSKELGWRTGIVYFEEQPLTYIVSRMSDYYDEPILIMNKALRKKVLTGSFKTDDLDGFLNSLQLLINVKIERNASGSILLL